MALSHDLGREGERRAAEYLQELGYRIVERNWRWGKAEADIIARQGEVLVFVEVKAGRHARFGYPEQRVDAKKQELLYELAGEYMHRCGHEGEIRFDIVAVLLPQTDHSVAQIRHFVDAFFPTW